MSKNGWTPGPWYIEKRGSIWQVMAEHRGPGSSFCVCATNIWCDDAESTARLIAAAPCMAEALEEMLYRFGQFDEDEFHALEDGGAEYHKCLAVVERARIALSKARGETQ